jgi:hypothetical protein
MYCEQSGKICNFTNNSIQDYLLPTLAIIRITLFCNLKIWLLRGELPQKIKPYVIIERKYEKQTDLIDSKDIKSLIALIA